MRRISCSELLQLGTLLIAAIGVCVAWSQLNQLNEEQRWGNYSELNARYADVYNELPNEILTPLLVDFSKLTPATKRAVRRYFDLYSEEYWLHKEGRIPDPMWTKRITNGVLVNFGEYPSLISGYRYWKEKGAFQHPIDFRDEVEKQITATCLSRPEIQPCKK